MPSSERSLPPMGGYWRAQCPLCGDEGKGGFRTYGDADKIERDAQDAAIFWQDMHMKTCPNKPHIPKILPRIGTKVIDHQEATHA